MSTAATLRTELRDLYLSESARIQQEFANTGDGSAVIASRTALVEKVLLRLWSEIICSGGGDTQNFALVALGGFGRSALFPHSDVDILFLHAGRVRSVRSAER
jgi:[protein-PII] uridylyltransferase